MKTTLKQCADIASALKDLSDVEMDYASAYAVAMLLGELNKHIQFFAKEEIEIVEKYAKKNTDGKVEMRDGGVFSLAEETAAEFHRKRAELDAVEVEINPITINPPERMKPSIIEALKGVVEFNNG